jgi:thiol-disulfide isomerase/thioredoxin
MKKLWLILLVCLIFCTSAWAAPTVYIRNQPVNRDIIVKQNEIYLPLEVLQDKLGVKLEVSGLQVKLNEKVLVEPPLLKNGVYFISLKEAATKAGFEYQFSKETNIIDVFKLKKNQTQDEQGEVTVIKSGGSWEEKIIVKNMGLSELESFKNASKGSVLILDFWATWCPPCRKEIPGFIELAKKYDSQGVIFAGLSVDNNGTQVVQKFVDDNKMNYPIFVVDDEVSNNYNISGIPATFIYDRNGNLANKHVGFTDRDEFETEIKALLK